MQDWVDVSGQGVLSLIGFTVLGLMLWALGLAAIKSAVGTLASLAGPTLDTLAALGGAQVFWAAVEGMAVGLVALALRRGWTAIRRDPYRFDARKCLTPQFAPALAAGAAVGLLALSAGLGILPTAVEPAGEVNVSSSIPALLVSSGMMAVGGGAGGGGPEIDIHAGYGAILALLAMLVIVGIVVGALVGGGLASVGLGAVSGAAEGATASGDRTRAGIIAGAASGAATGALAGAVSTALSVHLAYVFAGSDRWGPLVGFDILAAIFTVVLILLCRPTDDNPTGLWGNSIESLKVVIVLFQYALGLALVGLLLGVGAWILKAVFG
jgi:hypothetical protein